MAPWMRKLLHGTLACGWDTQKPLGSDAGYSSVKSKGKHTPRIVAYPDEDKLLPFQGEWNPMSSTCHPLVHWSPCPGKNTGVGCHFFLQGALPNPEIQPRCPALQVDSLPTEPPGKSLRLAH